MNPRRFTTVAKLCQTVVLAGWAVVWLADFGPVGTENTGAAPITDHLPSFNAAAEVAQAPQTKSNIAVDNADTAMAAKVATAAPDQPKSIAEATSTESPQMPETQPLQVATATMADPAPGDIKAGASSIEIFDECLVPEVCIDRYLWALYQRTPKEDTIKVSEQRKVTVKRKGKRVTVTRTFTRLVDEDFTWKDPKAAEKTAMPMMDYVIGGMNRDFKRKLFHALRAAEQAGLSPGITSAFRDDYRQAIASGQKAATDRSYHGGSFRGGYGHGLAADVVSVKGGTRAQRWISSEALWKWIDAHETELGIGRPYLDRDPPHLAPMDGKEFADHRGTKKPDAKSDPKKSQARLEQGDRELAKRAELQDRQK